MKRIRFNRLLVGAGAALLWWVALSGAARAQQTAGAFKQAGGATAPASNEPAAAPASAQQQSQPAIIHKPSIADFAWLEGRWRGEWGSRAAEQMWLGPKAGEMNGIFRLVDGDKTLVLELFALMEKPDGISIYFRHFTPELVPWEKSDATFLKLESVDATKAVFLNPVNGEPKRTSLIRVDADTYTARSEIEPEHGEPQTIEITFHRQKPPAAAPSGGSGAHRKKP